MHFPSVFASTNNGVDGGEASCLGSGAEVKSFFFVAIEHLHRTLATTLPMNVRASPDRSER